jgi:CHAD domain-containing protein
LLAANRDLHVQQVALKRLPICKSNGSCSVVWKRLHATQDDLQQHSEHDLKQFEMAVKGARVKVTTWKIDNVDPAFITRSLTRNYRRARNRFKSVCRVATGEKLHCWRRATKTFWHQLQLIDQISSKNLRALSCDAARLAKILGDEHDLFMLLKALANATDSDSRAVKRELRDLRRKLTKRAIKLGRKTFALAPSDFHERLLHCVK